MDASEVTLLLKRVSGGKLGEADAEELLAHVYDTLRGLAAKVLSDERQDHTLQPTALVHEAWMKVADQDSVEWAGQAHFLAIASQAMRRVLVDHARTKKRDKRGGGWGKVELDVEQAGGLDADASDLIGLDDALRRLALASPRQAQLVELRFFGGLPMEKAAEVMGVSLRSAERDWRFARAWLASELTTDS